MVFPVHLQRSAVAAILDCPVRHQFTGPESLKPVALQLIWLFQESLDTVQLRDKGFETIKKGTNQPIARD
jgi:hypothetical protein